MKLKILFLLSFSLLFCATIFAQKRLLGKVTDFKQQPVTDAQVFLNGQQVDVTINQRGFFEIEVPDSINEISVQAPKYGMVTTEYSGEPMLSFILLEYKATENVDVPIGYGEVDKKDLSYAVNKIDVKKDKNANTYANIYDYMRGRLPGVRVTSDNHVIIRGISSIQQSTDPLFVVNGTIVSNIDFINVNEIKDISILKGAAASIYGSRGSNGVILIKLKQ